MAAAELKIDARRKKILELLERSGHVYVTQLSEALGATTVTIRSDLKALETSGYLERVPGGAIAKVKLAQSDAVVSLLKEKRAIARACAARIDNGDTLFINSGTTTLELAYALRQHRNLNIVTSSIAIATLLSDAPSFRVILLGGELNVQYGFTRGGDAQDQLSKYQADHCILTLDGVSASEGITTYHADEAIIDRMMVERAKHTIVVADHSKIGRAGFSLICPINHIHTLITDDRCDADALKPLDRDGLRIIQAPVDADAQSR
jgi:DeoR/GlpR family transcriptional regulator of sugar metabolism